MRLVAASLILIATFSQIGGVCDAPTQITHIHYGEGPHVYVSPEDAVRGYNDNVAFGRLEVQPSGRVFEFDGSRLLTIYHMSRVDNTYAVYQVDRCGETGRNPS